ncbi:MAG: DNA polymerase III subunit delta [Verrucomicrobia bacterium]|jgi:DNA polymerase III subunit delta|nr:DNA polymerase III subunit delta [Verrucomicrobiota bacterium]
MPSKIPKKEGPPNLVCGDEDLAVKERSASIFKHWAEAFPDHEQEYIDAAAGNASEAGRAIGKLMEAMQTMPFFGTGKCIWFRNCNFLGEERTSSTKAVTEGLAGIIDELQQTDPQKIRVLISAGKVDKRKSFYKQFQKIGQVEIFQGWDASKSDWIPEAEKRIEEVFAENGTSIHPDAKAALIESVGPNARQLMHEAEKLALYTSDSGQAVLEDVQQVVSRNKQAKAFALGDALGNRNLTSAIRCLDEELWEMKLDRQRSAIGLLYGLISKVRTLILVKEMQRKGWLRMERQFFRFKQQLEQVPESDLPADPKFNPLRLNPYVLFRALPQASNYGMNDLVQAMETLYDANMKLISSAMDDGQVLQQSLVSIITKTPA